MKNFKFLSSLLFIVFTSNAIAGSGKAIVPHWIASPNGNTSIFVSNISTSDLKVTIRFFDNQGTLKVAERYENFQNSDTEVAAGKSAYVNIGQQSVTGIGYAIIEWENIGADDDPIGLVAYGQTALDNLHRASIPINGGTPF